MFHDVGKKLKICAYIFIVFYVFKSICFQFQFMWSLQSMMVLFIDFIFAMFIDFMGCAICFHPEISTPGDKILDETPIDLTFGREFETTNSPFVVIQKKKH